MSDKIVTQWSIQDTETDDVLGIIGGYDITTERWKSLEDDLPGRYQLVSRVVQFGDWMPS
jgi:hypothetical protein